MCAVLLDKNPFRGTIAAIDDNRTGRGAQNRNQRATEV
jgi:hypothetical protein